MKGQPDIIIMNNHKEYNGICIEFKSPTNNYQISEVQREMKRRYKQNGYRFLISNENTNSSARARQNRFGFKIWYIKAFLDCLIGCRLRTK